MGPVTLVARAEDLDYEAGRRSFYYDRYTAGARVQFTGSLVGHFNVIHQPKRPADSHKNAFDVGLTYVIRHPW